MNHQTHHINQKRAQLIKDRLTTVLTAQQITVIDESKLHIGHPGSLSGRGHFAVTIVAAQFEGLSLVKRHQLVYEALGSLLETDIHALRLTTLSPDEAS